VIPNAWHFSFHRWVLCLRWHGEFRGSVAHTLMRRYVLGGKMQYIEVKSSQIPLDLLLEADPSEASISSYLSDSWCFAALDNGRVLAACIVKPQTNSLAEIFNVSVYPKLQGQGVGSELLKSVLSQLSSKGISRVELGTGTFGYQLTYYQRLGFRVDSIVKDHFLLNYPEPIYENGIQHKDMLRLYAQL